MLNNLFSSFDEKIYFLCIPFLMTIYMLFMIKNFLKKSMMYFFFMNMMIFLNKFISSLNIFKVFFVLIFMINLISLNFFNFSLTSHLTFNLPLILLLWIPLLMMTFFKKNNMFLMHLVPLMTPSILIPIMIIIELISFFIRPMTLLLRLCINMIAGHVLVTLISNSMLSKNFIMLFPVLLSYISLKYMISFIQAYIITVLIQMYKEEIYVKNKF